MTIQKKTRTRVARKVDTAAQLQDLTDKYAAALATIHQLSQNAAIMSAQIGNSMRSPMMSGQLVVGIRNISNYTIGLSDTTTGNETVFTLHAQIPGVPDPKVKAVVSYAFWQQLRTSNMVGRGMIMRDDSILGPAENAAPEDRPEDVHPEAARNTVIDARAWITEKTEDELRSAVSAMTSEQSLRRLVEAVDTEVWNIGESKYQDDDEKARKAVKDLPAAFRIAEELFYERLDELNPVSKARDQETAVPRRYARS